MRNIAENLKRSRVIALVALALLATSCSRSLPTAPSAPVVNARVGAGDFATVGLENQVVITLAPGVDASSLAAQYGAVLVNSELGERTAALRPVAGLTPAALMAALQLDGRVETAEPNGWMQPAEVRQQSFAFDDGFGSATTYVEQPVAGMLHLDQAHNVSTGKGVKVAIIDTGADLTHPALRGSIIGGKDFVDNDSDPTDKLPLDGALAHGLRPWHARRRHRAPGGARRSAADRARARCQRPRRLRGCRGGRALGRRTGRQGHQPEPRDLQQGRRGCAAECARGRQSRRRHGRSTAAGNQGSSNVDFPGRSSQVECVAAVDANGAGASFSSFDKSEVALSAPGVAIRSTYPGGRFRLWSGTSMSAPFVAGAAALLAQVHPTWTLLEMDARLTGTAKPITSVPTGAVPPAQIRDFGRGTLDVGAALAPDFVPVPNQTPVPETIRPH